MKTTLNAYLTPASALQGRDLHTATPEQLAQYLYFSQVEPGACTPDGWVHVGTADIAVTLKPRAEYVSTQVAALRQRQRNLRAEAGAEDARLEREINSLLCIEGAVSESAS